MSALDHIVHFSNSLLTLILNFIEIFNGIIYIGLLEHSFEILLTSGPWFTFKNSACAHFWSR